MNAVDVDRSEGVVPRGEHPRPQFYRPNWTCLNGSWEFEFDPSDSGMERGLLERELSSVIIVPFAPEADLSGIGDTDFHEAVWYRRAISVPTQWPAHERTLLHFQAVDHDATVWVNGHEVGRHRGGFTPFTFDITDALGPERTGTVSVRARDSRHGAQARGKQATWLANTDCYYTRTTGIWQPVWMESVPAQHIRRPRITPDLPAGAFEIEPDVVSASSGTTVRVGLADESGELAQAETRLGMQLDARVRVLVPENRIRPWCPDDPHLYDVTVELIDRDGTVFDRVVSYAGLRSIAIDGKDVLLNGKRLFQRLVLDQGYWPGGLMTAPSDQALVTDIQLAIEAGFNGARVHEKIAEERFLYHADRLGYLLWGEFGDWGATGHGLEGNNQQPTSSFIAQWVEAVTRDYSHPSIVGWCPLNETYQLLHDRITTLDDVTAAMFWATKGIDPTRPVIDASGYSHRVPQTDIWDSHDYEQDPLAFARNHENLAHDRPFENTMPDGRSYSVPYAGQPFMVSEFGGIWWVAEKATSDTGEDREQSWGYGPPVAHEEEFYSRFESLVGVLDTNPSMFGYCYTQLTDVFQEENGIYRFDRSDKFDVARIKKAQSGRAAYEDGSRVT